MATDRAERPAARILVVDGGRRVLLLRFVAGDRPPFWCLPGGALDPGESYPAAARRELWEEVGLDRDCGPEVARRVVEFRTLEGVEVIADERFFRIDLDRWEVAAAALTPLEQRVIAGSRWFAPEELAAQDEAFYPVDLAAMLTDTAPTT